MAKVSWRTFENLRRMTDDIVDSFEYYQAKKTEKEREKERKELLALQTSLENLRLKATQQEIVGTPEWEESQSILKKKEEEQYGKLKIRQKEQLKEQSEQELEEYEKKLKLQSKYMPAKEPKTTKEPTYKAVETKIGLDRITPRTREYVTEILKTLSKGKETKSGPWGRITGGILGVGEEEVEESAGMIKSEALKQLSKLHYLNEEELEKDELASLAYMAKTDMIQNLVEDFKITPKVASDAAENLIRTAINTSQINEGTGELELGSAMSADKKQQFYVTIRHYDIPATAKNIFVTPEDEVGPTDSAPSEPAQTTKESGGFKEEDKIGLKKYVGELYSQSPDKIKQLLKDVQNNPNISEQDKQQYYSIINESMREYESSIGIDLSKIKSSRAK